MNTINMNRITDSQALRIAVRAAGLENDEYRCLSSRYDGDLCHLIVRTPYLRYEFYVDALDGEVVGISTEPIPVEEAVAYPACGREGTVPAAA